MEFRLFPREIKLEILCKIPTAMVSYMKSVNKEWRDMVTYLLDKNERRHQQNQIWGVGCYFCDKIIDNSQCGMVISCSHEACRRMICRECSAFISSKFLWDCCVCQQLNEWLCPFHLERAQNKEYSICSWCCNSY